MISKKQANQPTDKNDKQNTPPETDVSEIENKDEKGNPNITKEPSKEKEDKVFMVWIKRISPLIQLIMMILGVGTLVAYIMVNIDQGKRVKKSIEIANQSLIETQRSDSIAKQALIHTIRSDSINIKLRQIDIIDRRNINKIALRAYIGITDIKITLIPEEEISIVLYYINSGNTTATDIYIVDGLCMDCEDNFDNIMKTLEKMTSNENHEIKGPGIEGFSKSYNSDIIMDPITYLQITKGLGIIYYYGIIHYKDIFGDKHRIRYCRYYSAAKNEVLSYKYYNDEY